MAGRAGGARLLAVILVASETTEPFVDAHGRAIVAAGDLEGGKRRVAWLAERLPAVGADFDRVLAVAHFRKR